MTGPGFFPEYQHKLRPVVSRPDTGLCLGQYSGKVKDTGRCHRCCCIDDAKTTDPAWSLVQDCGE
jgi:hypothetical protein